jgi:regulatory protein YycH of two-component signal transduction system YycFG
MTKTYIKPDGNEGTAFVVTKKMVLSAIVTLIVALSTPFTVWAWNLSTDIELIKATQAETKTIHQDHGGRIKLVETEIAERGPKIDRNTENAEKLWPVVRDNQQAIKAGQAATEAELKALNRNVDRILDKLEKE